MGTRGHNSKLTWDVATMLPFKLTQQSATILSSPVLRQLPALSNHAVTLSATPRNRTITVTLPQVSLIEAFA
jgi:hypothetical protein